MYQKWQTYLTLLIKEGTPLVVGEGVAALGGRALEEDNAQSPVVVKILFLLL